MFIHHRSAEGERILRGVIDDTRLTITVEYYVNVVTLCYEVLLLHSVDSSSNDSQTSSTVRLDPTQKLPTRSKLIEVRTTPRGHCVIVSLLVTTYCLPTAYTRSTAILFEMPP